MADQNDRTRFKNRIFNTVASLGVIRSVSVTRDGDKNNIYVSHEQAFPPDFHLKYSEQYNCFHVYIHLKNREKEWKENNDYAIMVIDSGLGAADFVNIVQTLYRRRAGQRNG